LKRQELPTIGRDIDDQDDNDNGNKIDAIFSIFTQRNGECAFIFLPVCVRVRYVFETCSQPYSYHSAWVIIRNIVLVVTVGAIETKLRVSH